MKKTFTFVIITILLANMLPSYAYQNVYEAMGEHRIDVATKVRLGEFWGERWQREVKMTVSIDENSFVIVLYPKNDDPWNFLCKISIKEFSIPTKKEIRNLEKKDENWIYLCDIEYYYSLQYPSLEECFANYGGFVVNSNDPEAKKRTIEGFALFSPYFFTAGEKFGKGNESKMMIHLMIDEVGLAISMRDHLKF